METAPEGTSSLPHTRVEDSQVPAAHTPELDAPVSTVKPSAVQQATAVKPVSAAKPVAASDTEYSGGHFESGPDSQAPMPPSEPAGVLIATAPAPPERESSAPTPPSQSGTSPALHAEPQPESASAPVSHDVALRLDDGQNNVDIRMAERAGEIRVTVHTTDHDLASSLRADLPDLVGKLRQSGFQAEAWRPTAAAPQTGADRRGGDDRSGQQDSSGSRREGRQPQNQQQQRNPKRWDGEWQSSLDPAQESSK
jgi:hypothetical protein